MFFFTSINGDYTSNLILKNTLWGMRAKCCWEPTVGPTGSENNLVRIAQAVRCWTGTQVYMRLCASRFSRVQLCATVWTVACQAPLCMGFSRHEYWPPPGDLPYPWIKFVSLRSPALAGGIFTTSATWESYILDCKSSVRPRKSLLPFFFFLAGKSCILPPLSPTSDTVTGNGSTDGKGEERLNWRELKIFSAEGKQKKKKGKELWVRPQSYWVLGKVGCLHPSMAVWRVKGCLAFLEGGIKVCVGGQQKWVYMQSGWEKLRRKNYYRKVETEDGKEFKSTLEARQKDIIMETF